MIVIFQSARGWCACETNCNALYYAMPIETTRIVVNQAWISSKLKLIATLWKIKKELFSKDFPRHFQSFCCKIHVYWVINSLPPVCSHAIRTILMVWVRITLGFQPRVIRTQTINIFSYCMNKQGITNSVLRYYDYTVTNFRRLQEPRCMHMWQFQCILKRQYWMYQKCYEICVCGGDGEWVGVFKYLWLVTAKGA